MSLGHFWRWTCSILPTMSHTTELQASLFYLIVCLKTEALKNKNKIQTEAHYITLTGLECFTKIRLASNSERSSCLCLPCFVLICKARVREDKDCYSWLSQTLETGKIVCRHALLFYSSCGFLIFFSTLWSQGLLHARQVSSLVIAPVLFVFFFLWDRVFLNSVAVLLQALK